MAIHQWPPYIEINDLKNFRREALSVSGRIDYNSYNIMKSIQELRDWANACVERDLLERRQSITIKALPVIKTYKVESFNSSKVYTLTERNNHWTCTCPAYQFYSNRGYCKHIKKVKNAN